MSEQKREWRMPVLVNMMQFERLTAGGDGTIRIPTVGKNPLSQESTTGGHISGVSTNQITYSGPGPTS